MSLTYGNRDRLSRTPRAISFTSHDWSSNSARQTRRRPRRAASSASNTTSLQGKIPTKQETSGTTSTQLNQGAKYTSFGLDSLNELKRLKAITKGKKKVSNKGENKGQANMKKTTVEDDAAVNNAIRKLRQVFENKHSLRESFLEIDDNHDGKVSASELGTVLKGCGMHLEPHQLNRLISKFHNNSPKHSAGLSRMLNNVSNTKTKPPKSSSSSSSSLVPPVHDVQWSIHDGSSSDSTKTQKSDPGLPYDEFIKLVFIDYKDDNKDARRVQYLQNLNQGETVQKLRNLPQRSLEGRRIIDNVKMKVRNKIIERRGSSLRKVFRSFDTDKDGQVSLNEMEEQISHLLGNTVTPVEIGMLLLDLDKDGDGTINLREFSNLLGDQHLGGEGTSIASRFERNSRNGNRSGNVKDLESSLLTSRSNERRHTYRSSVAFSRQSTGSRRRPNTAPFGSRNRNNKLTNTPSGSSPSHKDLKADRGAMRRSRSKEYCLPPKGDIRELTFPFKELYKEHKVPTRQQHTPYNDTYELIATSRQRQRASDKESIRRASSLDQVLLKNDSCNIRSAVGFNFNHQDRERKKFLHHAKLSRVRKNKNRIEENIVGPSRFEAERKGDQRVQRLIQQRLQYYSKLQQRFERDRAMQLAAGV